MKEILLVAVLNMAIASCSPPKYTYYFDRYSAKIPTSYTAKPTSYTAKDAVSKSASITYEPNTANSSIPIHDQSLLANASNEVHVTSNKKTIEVEKDPKTSILEIRKTDRRKLLKSVREFKAKIELSEPGNKSKNWASTTGFILSLVYFLCIPAIIFSAIGLKSEKRKLAIAGMVIGLAVLVALLVMYAMFASG